MKCIFILNPKAGKRKNIKKLVTDIDSYMKASGIAFEIAFTAAAGDATKIAAKAAGSAFDLVVAVGGDGTVNEVASGLIKKKSALGIIPLGSGNGVARSLHIPLSLENALENLINQKILTIDIGKINDKAFIGIAGTGYDALVGSKFQSFGVRGPFPYFVIGTWEFFRYKSLNYRIDIDGEILLTRALMITFANTREYGNGAVIAPAADPSDGYLDLCLLQPQNLFNTMRAAAMLFRNNIDRHPGFMVKRCRTVHVQAGGENLYIHRDGEPDAPKKEVQVELIKGALNVCSPLGD